MYCPRKQQSMQFQDEFALKIDNVVSRNESFISVGDYIITYFKDVEKQSLETILAPYSLGIVKALEKHAPKIKSFSRNDKNNILSEKWTFNTRQLMINR